MSQRLVLKDSKLIRLTKYPGVDGTSQVLAVRALLTRTLAGQLNCQGACFAENNMPRRFGKLTLKEPIENCEIQIGADTLLATEVSHFSIARPKEASATDPSLEVSLSLHFAGSAPLNEWFDNQNKAEFEISIKPPETWQAQQSLFEQSDPDAGGGGDEPNCVDCENQIPFVEGSLSLHASGQACSRWPGLESTEPAAEKAPPLASAREAAGGTHQNRKGKPKTEEKATEAAGVSVN